MFSYSKSMETIDRWGVAKFDPSARLSVAVRLVRPWPDHFFGRKWFRPDHNFSFFGRKCVSLFDFFKCEGPIDISVLGQSARGRERRSL